MPWNSTWPVGTSSVQSNRNPGAQNTTYIETSLKLDHYWNEDAAKDGHHKAVQMPKTETGGTPNDPTIAASMDGSLYLKQKVSPIVAGFEAVLPFFKDDTVGPGPAILEMLGIRACAVFSSFGGTVTMQYSHNLEAAAVGPPQKPVHRVRAGVYEAYFDVELPSDNYLILGDCINNSAAGVSNNFAAFRLPSGATTTAAGKLTTQFQFRTINLAGVEVDCTQVWFVVFGG